MGELETYGAESLPVFYAFKDGMQRAAKIADQFCLNGDACSPKKTDCRACKIAAEIRRQIS